MHGGAARRRSREKPSPGLGGVAGQGQAVEACQVAGARGVPWRAGSRRGDAQTRRLSARRTLTRDESGMSPTARRNRSPPGDVHDAVGQVERDRDVWVHSWKGGTSGATWRCPKPPGP